MDDTKNANALEKPKTPKQPRSTATSNEHWRPSIWEACAPNSSRLPFSSRDTRRVGGPTQIRARHGPAQPPIPDHLGSPKPTTQDVSTWPRGLQRQAQYRMHRYYRHVECNTGGVGAGRRSGAYTGSAEAFGNQEAFVLGQAGPSMVRRLALSPTVPRILLKSLTL